VRAIVGDLRGRDFWVKGMGGEMSDGVTTGEEAASLKRVGAWSLLTGKADYEAFHEQEKAWYGCPPDSYPAFVTTGIDASEEKIYDYLYAVTVFEMAEMLLMEGAE
jgi:hypothetical protein